MTRKSKTLTAKEIKKHYNSNTVIELPLVRRAAHFFDWAAANYPYHWVRWNWALQAILGQARTPKEDSHAVQNLRGSSSRIRQILQTEYLRDFTVAKGLGARAIVDSEDALKTQAVKTSRRMQSAIRSAQKTFDLINMKQIPKTAENKPWIRWGSRSMGQVMKIIGTPEFERKLLAPGAEEKKDKK